MRVLVNAVSIREGGPRVVLAKLLHAMRNARPEVQWCVAAPREIGEEVAADTVAPVVVEAGRTPLHLLKWYEYDLDALARRWHADVVFSVTNYLPHRRLPVPTLLLEQHAGHFSLLFDRLTREGAPSVLSRLAWQRKRRWVHRSVEAATVLTVQTAALADAIAAATRVRRETIRVVAHGAGWVEQGDGCSARRKSVSFRLGYVTKWGVQKNFSTLFRAVKDLADRGRNVSLVLTLDLAHAPAAATLAEAEAMGVSRLIENRGEVGGDAISSVYDSLDAFVFPSLCESFGMPMAEAMARGLPIVVADTPVNREVTGAAGLIFSPFDAKQLAVLLGNLIDDEQARRASGTLSLVRGRDFSWHKAAAGTLSALDAAAGGFIG